MRGFEIVSSYRDKGIRLPERRTAGSAGYDLEAAEPVSIAPGGCALVPTGLKAYMEPDEVLQLHIRSGMAIRHKLTLMNSVGIIDADYYNSAENEGHILVAFRNHGSETVQIAKGSRIAQGIFMKYLLADGDMEGQGGLRQGGFGSTGET